MSGHDPVDLDAFAGHTPGPWHIERVDEEDGMIGWWVGGNADHVPREPVCIGTLAFRPVEDVKWALLNFDCGGPDAA